MTDPGLDTPAIDSSPAATAFLAKPAEVLAHLKEMGYAIEKSQLYEHIKAGMLPRRGPLPERGRKLPGFLSRDVDAYADRYLKASGTGQKKVESLEGLQRRRLEQDLGRVAAIRQLKEMEVAQLQGTLISRDRVEMELAARASVLKSDAEGFFRGEVPIIHAMITRGAGIPEVLEHCLIALHDWMHRYSQPIDWVAVLE